MIFWRGCCSQLRAIFRTGKNKWVVAGALPMPTNHGHTPWKMAKFIFRNFLTILVDTVGPNFIFWAHCAQNRNFLTILVDTVVPKLILDFFVPLCQKLKLFDNFRWQSVQNWNFLTILGDTVPKIETFWQFKVTQWKFWQFWPQIFVTFGHFLPFLAIFRQLHNFCQFLAFFENYWWFLPMLGDLKKSNLGEHWCTNFPT